MQIKRRRVIISLSTKVELMVKTKSGTRGGNLQLYKVQFT